MLNAGKKQTLVKNWKDDLMPTPKRQKKKSKAKPKKPTKDPNAPKRALSSFLAFSGELRPKINAEMPELKLTEVATELGRRWKALSDGEKQPYVDMAKKDKERYEAEMEHYVAPKEFRKKKKRKKGATKRDRPFRLVSQWRSRRGID